MTPRITAPSNRGSSRSIGAGAKYKLVRIPFLLEGVATERASCSGRVHPTGREIRRWRCVMKYVSRAGSALMEESLAYARANGRAKQSRWKEDLTCSPRVSKGLHSLRRCATRRMGAMALQAERTNWLNRIRRPSTTARM